MTIHKHKQPCVGAKAFIEKDGKLLILRHTEHEYTKKPIWGLPGGHLEWDEEPQEGLEREVREELGVDIKVIKPLFAWNKRISNEHQIILIGYQCELVNPNQPFVLAPDDDKYKWMSPSELNKYFQPSDQEYRPAVMYYFAKTRGV